MFRRVRHGQRYFSSSKNREKIIRHTEKARIDCEHLDSIYMHLITPKMPLWKANIDEAARIFPDPFWAFCWPGSYGLCRFLIYNPHTVANRNVLDFAAGCGIAGIVAKQLGAESVVINDIDELACDAAKMNAALNNTRIDTLSDNLLDPRNSQIAQDVILAGDVCYENDLAGHVLEWLEELTDQNKQVFLGDPGRQFLPTSRLEKIAEFELPPSMRDSNYGHSHTSVWTINASK